MGYIAVGTNTYKGAHRIRYLLESINKFSTNEGEQYKVVVLDDGSPDSGAALQNVADTFRVPIIKHSSNKGISASWNALSNYYDDAEITIILNDDIIVQSGWIKAMSFFLRENPGYAAASYPLYWLQEEELAAAVDGRLTVTRDPITRQPRPDWTGRHNGQNRPGRILCMAGCAFGYLRENFRKVGNFDEGYKSFFEESIPNDEYVYIKDQKGIRITTVEQLFNEWADTAICEDITTGKCVAFPRGVECLSAEISVAEDDIFLTVKEREILNSGARIQSECLVERRAKKKLKNNVSVNGLWKPLSKIIRHNRQSDLVRVRQKYGEITVTENHSMVIATRDGFEISEPKKFIEENLPSIDKLDIPVTIERLDLASYFIGWDQFRSDGENIWYLGKTFNGVGQEGKVTEKRASKKFRRWIDLSSKIGEDFCWCLGFFVAEGSTSIVKQNHNYYNTSLGCNSDEKLIKEDSDKWNSVFPNCILSISSSRKVNKKTGQIYKDVLSIHPCTGNLFGRLLRTMCGEGSRSKKIPDFIYNASVECRKQFLAGYFAGDALSVKAWSNREQSKPHWHIETTSRLLIAGISFLLRSLGNRFSFRFRDKTSSFVIRTTNQFKNDKGIKSVTDICRNDKYVYDLSVDDTHIFCAGVGQTPIHNSDWGTRAGKLGMPSAGISWPGVLHIWSQTFSTCPELNAPQRMQESRKRYIDIWNVPPEYQGNPPNCPFDYTNPKFMSKIPRKLVRWMLPDGSVKEEWDEGIVEHT